MGKKSSHADNVDDVDSRHAESSRVACIVLRACCALIHCIPTTTLQGKDSYSPLLTGVELDQGTG